MNGCWRFILCLIILCCFKTVTSLSKPTAIVPDPTYQTGVTTLITSNFSNTSPFNFQINYFAAMSTSSVNATLGIMGVKYYMQGNQFGWRMNTLSVNETAIVIQFYVKKNSNPIFYLRICYMISYNPFLELSWISYTFSKIDIIQHLLQHWQITITPPQHVLFNADHILLTLHLSPKLVVE